MIFVVYFFSSFSKIHLFKIPSVSISLDPEQAVLFVRLDLDQNSLRRTSAEETSRYNYINNLPYTLNIQKTLNSFLASGVFSSAGHLCKRQAMTS